LGQFGQVLGCACPPSGGCGGCEEIYIEYDGEDLEVMQYTGLKDKNGVEIYEGDILSRGDARSAYYIVSYEIGERLTRTILTTGTGSKIDIGTDNAKRLEVIGNIYQDPELVSEFPEAV